MKPIRSLLTTALVAGLACPPDDPGPPAMDPGDPFPSATPESQGVSSEALEGLVASVEGYLERDLFVGAEILVIKNRRTILQRSFGYADLEKKKRWTNGTVCNVRSMTKPLTGAAAQILVDRGQLDLDAPVARYLPGFDTDGARAITVRQIMTHRAGLPLTILRTMEDHADLVAMGNAVGVRGPEYEPGSRFWYSDAGTEALGAIVEVASDVRLDTFVQEALLGPLGMSDSFYFLDDADPRRSRIASLYVGGAGNWTRFLDPEEGAFYPFAWGSQSLYSTPQDYARFLAMWMDGGRVGDRAILSSSAVERTLTPVSEMSMLGDEARFPTSFTGLEVMYGQMAVLHVPTSDEAAADRQPVIIGHSGSDGTIAWAWPERDLMILFFTQSRGGGSVLRLEEDIDRLLITPEAWDVEAEVPGELQPFLGTYVADWGNHMKEEFVVDHRSGRFTLDVPSQMVFELVAVEGEDKWTFAIAPTISVWFERHGPDADLCLRIQQGPLTFEAPRLGTGHLRAFTEESRPDPEVVDRFLGKYHDPEEDEDVEVFVDGDYVAVRSSKGTFHLWKVPVADVWQVRENPMLSLTFQEEGGVVVSFTRQSPGGAELVFPRVE